MVDAKVISANEILEAKDMSLNSLAAVAADDEGNGEKNVICNT